jgi:glycosyltransferase involved in cell wall biosynthesis
MKALAMHLRDDQILGGCEHYRFRIPFEELRRHTDGFFDWASVSKVREWAQSNSFVKPTDYDLLLLPRHRPLPYEEGEVPEQLFERAEEAGFHLERKSHLLDLVRLYKPFQSIVLEYDDDYFTGSRDLGYDYQELLHRLLNEVDAVTVSTPYIRDLIHRYAPGIPVYVLPNLVNWEEWQGWDRWDHWPEGQIVLGLTGSSTHYFDWHVLGKVLPRVLAEHENVSLLMAGFEPDYLENLKVDFPERVVINTGVPYEQYPGLVRQADIVLCPVLPDDEFNLSKSAIKAIEGMAASRVLSDGKSGGAVPITSDLPYYRKVTGGDKRGLTVEHIEEAWYAAITKMVEDNKLRERLARKGHVWVHNHRSIERKWSLWLDAYREINRRKSR